MKRQITKRRMGKWTAALASAALLAGCGTPGIPLPPSLELPVPVADLRAARKGDRVYLAWTVPMQTTDRAAIRHLGPTRICRSQGPGMTACGTAVGEVLAQPAPPAATGASRRERRKKSPSSAKVTANYVDLLSADRFRNPTGEIVYAVEVENQGGRSAGLSNRISIPALPTLPPPGRFKAEVGPEGIVLSWDAASAPPVPPEIKFRYRVYRRDQGGTVDTLVGELPLTGSASPQLLDRNFTWEKGYEYRGNVDTVLTEPDKPEVQIEGDDTGSVPVFAHDVFPPEVPKGLQAVFSGVGQKPFIDLIWAPDGDADLAGYNLYRAEEGGQPVKINSEPVKAPAYRDSDLQPGKKYSYAVSAVDVRGNESARSEEANETSPAGP